MRKTILLLTMAALTLLAASHSFATTPPGTEITNIATVNYTDDNGNTGSAASLEVTTIVNTVHLVSVTSPETAKTGENRAFVVYAFNVENTGNVSDTFALAVNQSGSDWNPASVKIYADTNGIGVWDGELADISTTTALASEDVFPVLVVVEVPANAVGAEDTNRNIFTLTATGVSTAATDSVTDITTTIEASLLEHTLSVDSTTPVPGQTVTFIATITSTGTLAPGNVDFTATVPGGFTILSAPSITDGGGSIGAAGPVITGSNATLTDKLGSNLTWVITWSATVDATTSGSVTLTADATSTIVSDSITKTGTSETIIIVDVYSVTAEVVAPSPTSIAITPDDIIVFEITVTNTGNNDDTFELTHTNTSGWGAYGYYSDAGLAAALTDTNGGGAVDTGSIATGASTIVYLGMTSPGTLIHTDEDTLTLTATSATVITALDTTGSLTVDVQAPFLTIVKAVLVNGSASATANPGDTLTYTITVTNTGDGNAANAFIADAVPAYTTYVGGTLRGSLNGGGPDSGDTTLGDTVLIDGSDNIYAGNNGLPPASNLGDTAFALPVGSNYVLSFDVLVQ